ncbi:uncharacterized protein M6B38_202140 [Iris pallida]|uniref:WRC domain-containing protein n=1 Tax=Iris pallida TaxID=29817 RepID=A0AAX6DXZ4_IRIPA|nr:Uncharacterized protein M6B38_219865 [Iris pallida]KAJ6800817.1 uncharacterized protein M6B38_202140 [Iris pallida]
MRIRRRPSSSLNPDPSLQPPPKEEGASGGLHPDGDLPDPLLQTLHPQHNTLEVLKEEKIQIVDDSSPQQTLSYMHANGSGRGGSAAEVPFGVGLGWCNGESAVAVPRKRRGSRVGEEDTAKAKPVSSSNSIAPRNNSSNNNDDACGGTEVVMGEEGKRKKRGSPVLMEGSRCSRVNGRGWRCFQQTLVGYSLCEHHLGKGRLRSMSSVRGSKSGASTTTKHKDIVDGESTANLAGKKGRKKKIGTMKARSISTLLDETDHAAAAIISSLAVPVLEIDKRLV